MYDVIHTPCMDGAEQPVPPQNVPSERLSPTFLVSAAPSFSAMSTSALAKLCTREIDHYRNGEPTDERFGLELFRRAIVQADQEAWASLQQCYNELVLNWLHRHPGREVACRLEPEENYVAQTFERFWLTTAHHQKLVFKSLAAALQYLRMSLNSTIIDTLRTYSRPKEVPLPEPGTPGEAEPFVEDTPDSDDLWELLRDMFPNKRERYLVYLFFYCGLKPREIVRHCPQEFPDVREVYNIRRKIVERLVRDADRLRWRLRTDEDQINVHNKHSQKP